ncbi:MAG: hypothetical protein ACYC6Y_09605 [Thermoguttaceae bacterium]
MTRTKMMMGLALMLAATVVCVAAEQGQRGGPSRGGMGSRNSLLGLLGREQVQQELKLTEEETAKVKEVVDKLRDEMRTQYQALENTDPAERRAKLTQLSEELDEKVREQLRDVVPREKMMRLYQIRMQVRPVSESLASRFAAERLKLTDEQKAKLEEIKKDMQTKQSDLFGKARSGGSDRSGIFQQMRDIQTEADQKALGVLTEEQKKSFEEMKGAKFELQMEGPRRGGN